MGVNVLLNRALEHGLEVFDTTGVWEVGKVRVEGVGWKQSLFLGALVENVVDCSKVCEGFTVLTENGEELLENLGLPVLKVVDLGLEPGLFVLDNVASSFARVAKFGGEPPLVGESLCSVSDQVCEEVVVVGETIDEFFTVGKGNLADGLTKAWVMERHACVNKLLVEARCKDQV